MVKLCKHIVQTRWFNNTVLIAILLAGVIVGIETYGNKVKGWLPLLHVLDWLILWVFTLEAAIKIISEGKKTIAVFSRPLEYF